MSYTEAREWMERAHKAEQGADRLYQLLAYFDTRDDNPMAALVRTAREGWERAHPDMAEASAWDEFDALWSRRKGTSDGAWPPLIQAGVCPSCDTVIYGDVDCATCGLEP
jgi:hypothetical protein